jgi:DNA-binding transcriptional ArsR family regulator
MAARQTARRAAPGDARGVPASRRNPGTTRPDARGGAPVRPAVRDFSGAAAYAIEWDVRPVFDFVFSMSEDAGSTDDLPAADRQWLDESRASLKQNVRASAERLFASEVAIHVAEFAVERPELRTARQYTDAVEAAAPATVLASIFGEVGREQGLEELIADVLAGRDEHVAEIEERMPEWHRKARIAMLRDPGGTHASIVAVLRAWLERYEPIEDRVTAILSRDYASRDADRESLRGADLIEHTTNGLRWLGEPGIRRVILAPSYFSRPFNFLLAGPDWRFFGYPVADDALGPVDPLAPPAGLLRLHRALGDDTRLRILKLLGRRDLYLTEIAQELDLSKPTIKHHLALLRAAGLVTVTESGTVMYYSLRREPLDAASTDLKRFLVVESRKPT